MVLIYEKMEALYAEFNERAEATTSGYSATDNFLQYYSVVVALRIITRSDQGV